MARPPGITFLQSIALFFGLLLFMALPPLAVVVTTSLLSKGKGMYRAEIVLPAVVLVGVVTLIGVLTLLVLVFSRLDLTNREGALGLPDGTIQAVIALALILIFAIVGVYLHGVSGNGETRTLGSLTRAQVDALPAAEIVSERDVGGGRWEAVIQPRNEQQDDIAKQLLTTISTLVVAVAGFYFGSKSVRDATRVALGGPGAAGAAVAAGGPTEPDEGEDEEVDEPSAYGERSPVTGLGQADVEDAVDGAPAETEEEEEPAATDVAATEPTAPEAAASEPSFEEHPDYQDEPDFYPDEEDQAGDEDSPPEPAEGDEEDEAQA